MSWLNKALLTGIGVVSMYLEYKQKMMTGAQARPALKPEDVRLDIPGYSVVCREILVHLHSAREGDGDWRAPLPARSPRHEGVGH